MTDDNVEPVQTETVNDAVVSPSPQVNKPTEVVVQKIVEKKGGSVLSVLAILLSLGAVGGSGYNWYNANVKGQNDGTNLAVKMTQIGGDVSRIGDTVLNLKTQQNNVVTQEQLTTRLLESNSAVDLRFRDVSQSQQTLADSVSKINSSLDRGVKQFVIDEVSQLLKLANNNVLFSSNTTSAINALKLADLQLKELSDPRYSVVRKKINQEIGVLQGINQVDIESVSVQISSLSARIPSLKLDNEIPTLGAADISLEIEDQAKDFKATAKEMLNDLIALVQIQKIEQAPKPLLAPEQRYFLDQNIQLQLAKAELSLVQNRAPIYADSLSVASAWLSDYFDIDDAAVQEVQEQINELKKVQLGQDLPSIAGSYTLLQSIKGGE